MSKEKKAPEKKATGTSSILKTVTGQLTKSLNALEADLGAKKFKKRIKKAAKILVDGIKKTPAKKVAAKGKKIAPAKKKAVKKTPGKK